RPRSCRCRTRVPRTRRAWTCGSRRTRSSSLAASAPAPGRSRARCPGARARARSTARRTRPRSARVRRAGPARRGRRSGATGPRSARCDRPSRSSGRPAAPGGRLLAGPRRPAGSRPRARGAGRCRGDRRRSRARPRSCRPSSSPSSARVFQTKEAMRMSGESDVQDALRKIFDADTGIYAQRGFQGSVGLGTRAALVHIDLANAWTRPGNAFTCDGMDTIIPAVQKLNEAGRAKGIPIVYTTTAYTTTGSNSDMGLWVRKIPVEVLQAGTEAVQIDSRIAPRPDERVIVKKPASGFHGTDLSSYLNALGVDTVILTGVTMCGCVRHSCEDAIAEGFRPIVVREAVGNGVPAVLECTLFDVDAKFGDVEPLE